jgi:hypothetical protein
MAKNASEIHGLIFLKIIRFKNKEIIKAKAGVKAQKLGIQV